MLANNDSLGLRLHELINLGRVLEAVIRGLHDGRRDRVIRLADFAGAMDRDSSRSPRGLFDFGILRHRSALSPRELCSTLPSRRPGAPAIQSADSRSGTGTPFLSDD